MSAAISGVHSTNSVPDINTVPDIAALIRASVTGLDWSIPFCVIRLPGTCFCTGSVRWPSPYGVH